MQRSTTFLNHRPSQIAAASVLLALNVSVSHIATELELTCVNEQELRLNSNQTAGSSNRDIQTLLDHPLRHWNQTLRKLTGLSPEKHINQTYMDLIKLVNKDLYNNRLAADYALFIATDDASSKCSNSKPNLASV